MLKKALVGLAALHDRNIIHTGGLYALLSYRCFFTAKLQYPIY